MAEDRPRVLVTGSSGFIGTNLVRLLAERGHPVAGLDTAAPRYEGAPGERLGGDLRDERGLTAALRRWRPDHVVNLAARTDLDGETVDDYDANTLGVECLAAAVTAAGVRRVVHASSKFVCRNGYSPRDDADYCPDTVYGESKARGEVRLRERMAGSGAAWCIVRPTSIWGPWMGVPYLGFFRKVARGLYVHPGLDPPRAFGFVGNTCHQIAALLEADAPRMSGRTFYVSDYEPYTILQWANYISERTRGRSVRVMPAWVAALAARIGDAARALGVRDVPLTTFRLRNMWADTACVPLDPIREIAPGLPFGWREGVDRTLEWLERESPPD